MNKLTILQRSPVDNGVALFCVIKNEADLIPLFLDHYRRLGVRRFFVVDNGSTDDLKEALNGPSDVNLYFTTEKFREHNCGNLWLDGLMQIHAANQWVLRVDADELLVFDGAEKRGIDELTTKLEQRGETRLLAPLVDVYGAVDRFYFDAIPLATRYVRGLGLYVEGGPRARMNKPLGEVLPCLTKYPLVFYDPETCFANVHFPIPRARNTRRILGALIHVKLIEGRFNRKVANALEEQQHWHGSSEYKAYEKWLHRDLRYDRSELYQGPNDLVRAGIMRKIGWIKMRDRIKGHLMKYASRVLKTAT